jgi:hypothetical protein
MKEKENSSWRYCWRSPDPEPFRKCRTLNNLNQSSNTSVKARGVGRKEPGRDTGPTFESAVGKPAAAVLGAMFLELSSVGRRVEGGEDEDEAHTTRTDDWIVWEIEGAGGRGL